MYDACTYCKTPSACRRGHRVESRCLSVFAYVRPFFGPALVIIPLASRIRLQHRELRVAINNVSVLV